MKIEVMDSGLVDNNTENYSCSLLITLLTNIIKVNFSNDL